MKNKLWGLLLLLLVIGGAVAYSIWTGGQQASLEITGLLGGEKIGLFQNKKFKDFVKKNYNLTMDYRKAGSFEMVKGDLTGQDYLFPSSQLALELFKHEGQKASRDEIIFNTPIVLYSYKPVVDALVKEGIVTVREGVHYVNMPELAKLIVSQKTWQDLGLTDLYGEILVDTTDPAASNSGNMFLGLLANALNSNKMVSQQQAEKILPDLQKIYQTIGYMNTSSADLFNQFLTLGVGSYPLIAGYESQLLEFSVQEPETYQKVKDEILILYPEPTVWSSHILIALNDQSERAIDALLDKKVQDLAWTDHGYRTIVAGSQEEGQFKVPGLAPQVTQIMQMPSYRVMDYLVDGVSQ